jgi:hypothetical protein
MRCKPNCAPSVQVSVSIRRIGVIQISIEKGPRRAWKPLRACTLKFYVARLNEAEAILQRKRVWVYV